MRGIASLFDGKWIDDTGRVLEVSSAGGAPLRVTARPGEDQAPYAPSNLFFEDTVEARDLPAEPCEAWYPLPSGSPCIRVETGAAGLGRTLRLTLVSLIDAADEASGFRAPKQGDPDAVLRLLPEIGSSYIDAVALHENEAAYERLPWAEPLRPYRRALGLDGVRLEVAALCARVLADEPRDAETRLDGVLRALHRIHPPLSGCGPIAALRLLGSKVDSYSYGVVQEAAVRWLAASSAEAAAHVAAEIERVRARMTPAGQQAIDAFARGLAEPYLPEPAIEATERFAHLLTECRFIPILSVEQGRRLLAWKTLDEALSWARECESRVARPRGFAKNRYVDERRDAGNWWNNDVEHFVIDLWTGEWVFVFYANERNSSDTYEGCRGVRIDNERRQVIVRHYAGEPDEVFPFPDEAQPPMGNQPE